MGVVSYHFPSAMRLYPPFPSKEDDAVLQVEEVSLERPPLVSVLDVVYVPIQLCEGILDEPDSSKCQVAFCCNKVADNRDASSTHSDCRFK